MTVSPSGSVTELHPNVGEVSFVATPSIGDARVGAGGALFGRIVSTCVALVRPSDDAVTVGVPTTESRYLKLAVLEPLAIVTNVITVAGVVASRNSPPRDDDDRSTTVEPLVTTLPNWSRRCTVRFAELESTFTETGVDVKASWLAASGVMLNVPLVAPVRPVLAAVRV